MRVEVAGSGFRALWRRLLLLLLLLLSAATAAGSGRGPLWPSAVCVYVAAHPPAPM